LAIISLFAGCSQWNDLIRGNQSSTVGTAPVARSGTVVVGEPAGTSRSTVVVAEPAGSNSMAPARPAEPTGAAIASSTARNTTNSGNNEIGTAATSPTYGGGTPRSAISAAEKAGQTAAPSAPPATIAQSAPPASTQALPSKQVSDVRSAQQALKDDGYNVGPIDGKMGPKTAAALRKFQKDHGIQATGRLDSQTMAALGSSTGSTS
jgi:hypothetical protein